MKRKTFCLLLIAFAFHFCHGGEVHILRSDSGEKVGSVRVIPGAIVVRDQDENLLWCKVDESLTRPKPEAKEETPGAIGQIIAFPFTLVASVVVGVCAIIKAVSKANL